MLDGASSVGTLALTGQRLGMQRTCTMCECAAAHVPLALPQVWLGAVHKLYLAHVDDDLLMSRDSLLAVEDVETA